jgi:hypothetical protein
MAMNVESVHEAGGLKAGILESLVQKLAPYDPADILAAVGGLQLLPENADRAVRLEAFAHAAAALENEANKSHISLHRLRQFANSEPLGGVGVAVHEDPCDNAVTEAFTYHDGMYIVFPGQTDEVTFHLRHLAAAVSADPDAYPVPDFVVAAAQLLKAVLVLSTEIAWRAGLGRAVLPIFRGREADVVVPESKRLAMLKQAVSFSRAEIEQLLAERHLTLSTLDQLIIPLDTISIVDYQINHGDLQIRPIVQADGQLIVAIPSMLLVAARHALIRLALEYGVQTVLAQHYHESVWQGVVQSLQYLGNPSFKQLEAVSSTVPCVRYGLFHMDKDKLICAILATDAFERYPHDRAFSWWQWEREQEEIRAQIRLVEEAVFSLSSPPNEILFLVLLQSSGRTLFWDYRQLETPASPLLILTAADLETIAFLESEEQLALWKYARHAAQVRERAHVWAETELNEFGLYRSCGHSYYVTNQERPEALQILPGVAGDLRQEVLHDYDRHAVPSYVSPYVTDVITMYGTRDVPLYVPLRPHDRRPACLVEGLPLPIWIIGPALEENVAQENLGFSLTVASGIAYWLWQCTPSLKALLRPLSEIFSRIVIECSMKADEGQTLEVRNNPADLLPMNLVADPAHGALSLVLDSSLSRHFADAQNASERALLCRVLQGLRELLPVETQTNISDSTITAILDRHAPLGLKKTILYTDVNAEPALDPRHLPRYRPIQEADANDLLDELGDYLKRAEHLEPGPLPEDQRTTILRKVVAFYTQELIKLVASLSPEGLLEMLIALQEATIYESSYRQLTIPTQLACFSNIPRMIARLSIELPDLVNASIASRFLIEYVATCPPSGRRMMSLSVYDRLLALASHITTFGFASDMIHFKIADIGLEILPSGRLAVNQEQYLKAKAAYLPDMLTTAIEQSTEAFSERWYPEEGAKEVAIDLGVPPALDKAAQAEFGCSLSDLQRFLAGAFSISENLDPAYACLAYDEFLDRQAAHLGWSRKQVANVLKNLTLPPRQNFVSPPAPYQRDEIYPWRYNRRLSCVRRPFALRSHGEITEVLWGNRLLYRAALVLLGLCYTGLFQADTQRMKQVMGSILHHGGERFNDAVAEALESHPELIVVRRVKEIGDLPGDIDVLVADPQKQRLGILECKNFKLARTPREVAYELDKLFEGKHGGKTQSEKRADWARNHIGDLLETLGLSRENASKWRVEPLIVVSQDLFSPYLRKSSIPVVSLQKLIRERLW